MNAIIYIYVFLIGIVFGSFFTLAVYRIPKGQTITHERSYCPKCNHKLSFWDMIPLFSYIFLGGRCRYCKEKIRPRYFLLELFAGIVFVLFAISIKLNIFNLNAQILTYFIFGLLYIASLFIISGIDKENVQVPNQILLFLTIVETIYIIYLYIVEKANIYTYVIYLILIILLNIINIVYFRKKVKDCYTIQILLLIINMLLFTYEGCTFLTIEFTLLSISIKLLIDKIREKRIKYKKEDVNTKTNKIPFAFYLCVTNIIMLIWTNIIIFYF